MGVDEGDVLDGVFNAGLDSGSGAVVLVKIDVELFDGVEKYQEILVVGVRGEVPSDVLQAAVAAVVGRWCLVLCVGFGDLCGCSPGFL